MLWARAQQHVCSPLFTNVTTDPKEVGKATGLYAVADSNGSAGVVLLTDSIYQIATTKTDASASAVQGCKSCKDVRDPCNPHPVRYLAAPENTWNIHLQAHEDLLLVIHAKDLFSQPDFADERNYYKGSVVFHARAESKQARNWSAGLAVYDISKPDDPHQIGFMPVNGGGLHRADVGGADRRAWRAHHGCLP